MSEIIGDIQLLLCNRNGWQIAEADVDLKSVSWRLGQTGQAKFSLSYNNPAALTDNLLPGNRVLLQFQNGLPDWGGVIDLPRSRDGYTISLTAYEGDYLLGWRATDMMSEHVDAPGAIVASLLSTANSASPTGITMGDQFTGGSQTRAYHYDALLASVRDLSAGYDYAVVPSYQSGRVQFLLHWYSRRGLDRRNSVLLAEQNYDGIRLEEQGPIHNRVYAIGAGTTWTERPVVVVEDLDSQYLYGLREHAIIKSSISDEDTLEELAQAALDEAKAPRSRATLTGVTDREPAPYARYHVGDIVTLQAFSDRGEWAFDSPVRVLAREWTSAGHCTVEVEEWRG